MKKLLVVSCLLLVASSSVFAAPAVIGGIRDGLAIGLMIDNPVARNVALRVGIEANSGKQPMMVFFGGRFYLTSTGGMPMSLGLHGVGYTGGSDNKTDVGFGLSFIFDRAFSVPPMFLEFGVDVANTARLQAQVGYKIY
jgi:hypothetical protein